MNWFLRLSCLVIVLFGFYVLWLFVVSATFRPAPPPPRGPERLPAAYHAPASVPAFPVDHVAQRLAI